MTGPALTPGDLVRIRGQRWRVGKHLPYDGTSIVEVDGSEPANRGTRAHFLLPFEPFDRLTLPRQPRVVRPGRWRHLARRALADAVPQPLTLRASIQANVTPIPFQLEPVLAMVRGDGCRFLIADAVGMGKTIQAGLMIAELIERNSESRVLMIAPAGLREQWRDELHNRFHLDAVVLDSAGVARTMSMLPSGMNPWQVHRLVITSIDFVKRPEVIRCHESLIWDLVVFDEAHGLSGHSDRSTAAAALACRARCVVMLTATPHTGDDVAFRRMCQTGELKDDAPLVVFRRTRRDVDWTQRHGHRQGPIGPAGSRRTVVLRVRPTPGEAAMHAALADYAGLVWSHSDESSGARLAISVLLRRACSSAASLARSVERRIALLKDPEPYHQVQASLPLFTAWADEAPDAVLAPAGLADSADELSRLKAVFDLAREAAAAESKLAALRRFLRRSDEPAIVFTEYRDTLRQIDAELTIPGLHLHGGLTGRERAEAVRQFVTGAAPLLLATDAASEGLNLHQRCRLVVNLELPWTPLRLEQRAGRVDRLGQARRVHVMHLIAAGTSEERVLERLSARTQRLDEVAASPGSPDDAKERSNAAHQEAERILIARALKPTTDFTDDRPVITHIRRRSRHAASGCYWVFRLVFTDADGRVVHQAVTALRGEMSNDCARWHGLNPNSARMLLDARQLPVQRVVREAQESYLTVLRKALDRPLMLLLRRETAIADALRAHYARMSAGLLQLGLFDRRNDRAVTAQSALLSAVLAESDARGRALAACLDLRATACDLVCAIARD